MRNRFAQMALLALGAFEAAAAGPVFNVNSFADVADASPNGACDTGVGVCTLRAAIMEANTGPHDHAQLVTINLQAGTYTFTVPIGVPDDARNGDLNLHYKTRLQGAGMLLTTIEANGLDRAFFVAAGADSTIADLTIQGGRPPASGSRVGGGDGGGIYVDHGSLTLLRTLVRANSAASDSDGGGVKVSGGVGGGSLTIGSSALRANTALYGGAVDATNAPVSIFGSSITANGATFSGAGLYVFGGSLYVLNSTMHLNTAGAFGGAARLVTTTAFFNNATVTSNIADVNFDGIGAGGGLSFNGSVVTLSNSILDNFVLIADDESAQDDLECPDASLTSNGHNLIRLPGGCVTGASQAIFHKLGDLQENGGHTVTRVPDAGSPAIDAGTPTGCVNAFGAHLPTDQRGVVRPIGVACDLGAVEAEPRGDANGDGSVSVSDVFHLINYLFAAGPLPLGRGDANKDFTVNVPDVFFLINYLFAGGPAPGARGDN